jgi:hypothetical protein
MILFISEINIVSKILIGVSMIFFIMGILTILVPMIKILIKEIKKGE